MNNGIEAFLGRKLKNYVKSKNWLSWQKSWA